MPQTLRWASKLFRLESKSDKSQHHTSPSRLFMRHSCHHLMSLFLPCSLKSYRTHLAHSSTVESSNVGVSRYFILRRQHSRGLDSSLTSEMLRSDLIVTRPQHSGLSLMPRTAPLSFSGVIEQRIKLTQSLVSLLTLVCRIALASLLHPSAPFDSRSY